VAIGGHFDARVAAENRDTISLAPCDPRAKTQFHE
jgi:hypothetical protein